MHIRTFDKAVKRYREWIHNAKTVSQRRGRRWNRQGRTTAEAEPSQGQARSTSRSSAEKQRADAHESHARAQETLESLPNHVLHHAKTFHTYIRLFVDDANVLDTRSGGAKGAMDDEVSITLRRLLDKIARLGGIGKGTKDEILRDPDARHVSNASLPRLPTHHVPFPIDPVRARH
jgi:potassium channel subfamily K, other eukaryote